MGRPLQRIACALHQHCDWLGMATDDHQRANSVSDQANHDTASALEDCPVIAGATRRPYGLADPPLCQRFQLAAHFNAVVTASRQWQPLPFASIRARCRSQCFAPRLVRRQPKRRAYHSPMLCHRAGSPAPCDNSLPCCLTRARCGPTLHDLALFLMPRSAGVNVTANDMRPFRVRREASNC